MAFTLLSTANTKTIKGESKGYATYILHLAPVDIAGCGNVCPKATAGCKAACLNTAGHGGMFKVGEDTNTVQEARKRKTRAFFQARQWFMSELCADIEKAIKQAAKKGLTPVFRLNGTSDISWEKIPVNNFPNVFKAFPDVQFYDYTKVPNRKVKDIPNYHLTFSQADGNDQDVYRAIAYRMNVAVVFDKIPSEYKGLRVVNGDETDLRFLDPKMSIIGLTAKGKAKKDTSGFVVRTK